MLASVFRPTTVVGLLLGALAMAAAGGCATTSVQDKENLMSAAGFTTKSPQNAEQQAKLDSLQQHKLLRMSRDGKVFYVYADREGCNCIYIGNEAQNAGFQRIMEQRRIADQNLQASQNYAAGPAYWWWY